MKPQIETLRYFAAQGRRGGTVRGLAEELGITHQAASARLVRLWRERLIAPVPLHGEEPGTLKGERVEDLVFQLTPRGRERLAWARKSERKAGDRWPF